MGTKIRTLDKEFLDVRTASAIMLMLCFTCACDFRSSVNNSNASQEHDALDDNGHATNVLENQDLSVQIATVAREYLSQYQQTQTSVDHVENPAHVRNNSIVQPNSTDVETISRGRIEPLMDKSANGLRILFVGNSYMAYKPLLENEKSKYSVANQFVSLIEQDNNSVDFTMRSIGGGTLKEHWEQGQGEGTPRADIASGRYDLLVIQGRYDIHRSSANRKRFDNYIDLFLNLAASHDVKALVYGLWSTDKWINADTGDTFGPVAHDIYRAAAKRHGASYAPNGMAYTALHSYLSQKMDETLVENYTTDDQIHPSIAMAYMIANVVYSTIFVEPAPLLSRYRPPGLEDEVGAMLRDFASSAVTRFSD